MISNLLGSIFALFSIPDSFRSQLISVQDIVFNRTRNDVSKLEAFAKELGLEIFGAVPMDEEVEAYDSEGKSLLELSENNPALEAVRQVYKKL